MFVPQDVLETWAEDPDMDVGAETVVFRRAGMEYRLEPAVLFSELVSEDGESALLGKVMTESKIQELEGELMGDSVIFGEAAFRVRLGFLAARGAK